MRCNWLLMRLLVMKRRLNAEEWMACAFGVTAVFCALIGEVEQFSVYAVFAVFWFVLSRVK